MSIWGYYHPEHGNIIKGSVSTGCAAPGAVKCLPTPSLLVRRYSRATSDSHQMAAHKLQINRVEHKVSLQQLLEASFVHLQIRTENNSLACVRFSTCSHDYSLCSLLLSAYVSFAMNFDTRNN